MKFLSFLPKGLAEWNLSHFNESLESINIAIENYKPLESEDDEIKGSNKAILLHNRYFLHFSGFFFFSLSVIFRNDKWIIMLTLITFVIKLIDLGEQCIFH